MRILNEAEVAALLPIEATLEIVRAACAEYSAGRAMVPVRTRLVTELPAGELLVMPGYVPKLQALGVKIYSTFENSASPGLFASSAVLLFRDLETGDEALLDAGWLTALRTGAMTALACKYLAIASPRRLALIGAGPQGRSQLDAVLAALPVGEVRVFARNGDRRDRFVAEATERHPEVPISAARTAEDCATGADIIVAATTSPRPVVSDDWVMPGSLVCSIGSHTPDSAEIDPRTVARSTRIVVDSRAGAMRGSADIGGPLAAGKVREENVVELGELVLGRASGRSDPGEIAVFKSVGFAALDVAAARYVVARAIERQMGIEVALR